METDVWDSSSSGETSLTGEGGRSRGPVGRSGGRGPHQRRVSSTVVEPGGVREWTGDQLPLRNREERVLGEPEVVFSSDGRTEVGDLVGSDPDSGQRYREYDAPRVQFERVVRGISGMKPT